MRKNLENFNEKVVLKKVVLVTGASRGIGKRLCEKLLEKDYLVYAAMRKCSNVLSSENFIPVLMDLTNGESIESAVSEIFQRESQINALYHVAGEAYYCPVESMTLQEAHRMFEVNFFGAFRLTQLVIPHMRNSKRGKIVFTSSIRAIAGCAFMGMYGGSKAALEAMAFDLRETLCQWNIDVVVVEPGPVDSGITIKTGSYSVPQNTYKEPEMGKLEYQGLDSASEYMANILDMKNPPFRLQTSIFAKNMIETALKSFIDD